MNEFIQILICLWETVMPFAFADQILVRRNLKIPLRVLWYICMGINMILLIYQRNIVMYSRLYLLISTIISMILLIWRFRVSIKAAGLGIWIYYESVYVLDLFIAIILSYLYEESYFFNTLLLKISYERLLIYILSRTIVMTIMYLIFQKKNILKLYHENLLIFVLIPIVQHASLFQCDVVFTSVEKKAVAVRHFYIYLFVFVCIICGILLLYTRKKMEYEKALIEEKARILELDCARILTRNQERDILLHDIQNHYSALYGLVLDNQIAEVQHYLEQLQKTVNEMKPHIQTGNIVIDAILNDKLAAAKKENILLKVFSDDMKDSFVEDQDWCILLANLLDNAIEACQKVKNRTIEMEIEKRQYGIMINMKNSSNEIRLSKDGKMQTTKKEKQDHGLGMISVQNVVEKYAGTMKYHYKEGVFQILVTLYPV